MFGYDHTKKRLSLYVDTNAQSDGDGTIENPYKSIFYARSKIRELKDNNSYPENGVEVVLRKGFYSLPVGIVFNEQDSGKENAEVIYRAYGNEVVTLSSGVEIELSQFSASDDSRIQEGVCSDVVKINLDPYNIAPYNQLQSFGHGAYYLHLSNIINGTKAPNIVNYNDELMHLARYPNEGYMNVSRVQDVGDMPRYWLDDKIGSPEYIPLEERNSPAKGMTFGIEDNRISHWENAQDLWVYGYWRYDWSDLAVPVDAIDADTKTIKTALPSAYGVNTNARFYVYNLLEELDCPGEWYYNTQSKDLFIYPLDDDPHSTISFSNVNNNIINLENASNIKFCGITLKTGNANAVFGNGKNISIVGCTIKDISGSGISLADSTNVYIAHNKIFQIGGSGIYISGGDRQTLEPTNNVVNKNTIHSFAKSNAAAVGIHCNGVGHVIKSNVIFDSRGGGLKLSGNDHRILNNEFYNLLKESTDNGIIYMGRSMVSRGNLIAGNYIHDIESDSKANSNIYGIYLDDQFSSAVIKDNIVSNIKNGIGVFLNGGRDNVVKNNTFCALQYSIRISCPGRAVNWNNGVLDLATYGLDGSIPYTSPAYAKYPNLANILVDDPLDPKYNLCMGNKNYSIENGEYLISTLSQYGSTMTEAEIRGKNIILEGTVYQ